MHTAPILQTSIWLIEHNVQYTFCTQEKPEGKALEQEPALMKYGLIYN